MVSASDKEYMMTKLLKKGEVKMEELFVNLAAWIAQTFNVTVLNIIYDTIDNGQRPRLQIIFEIYPDYLLFMANYGYDRDKQKLVATQFGEVLKTQRRHKRWSLFDFFKKRATTKYSCKNIWIAFSAFDKIAMEEANRNISEEEVQQLEAAINMAEIWRIYPTFSSAVFFFYTEEQVVAYKTPETEKYLAERYYQILKPHDEFDYIKKSEFKIELDSKERFDDLYKGSWFNYYKR